MEQIKRDNAEITHYQVSEDVSFSPALLFDPIDVARREIPDLPIEIEENSVETIDFDVETSGQPTHSIESQVEPSEPSMTESKAMTEATETKRSPSEDSMATDHFSSLLQEIREQKKLMAQTAHNLAAPFAPATRKSNSFMHAFNRGMIVFDGIIMGMKMMRKIRNLFGRRR